MRQGEARQGESEEATGERRRREEAEERRRDVVGRSKVVTKRKPHYTSEFYLCAQTSRHSPFMTPTSLDQPHGTDHTVLSPPATGPSLATGLTLRYRHVMIRSSVHRP